MDIGEALRLRRVQLKMTQIDLARKTGIKQPTISAIETGTNKPNIDTIVLLSQALDCTVSDLLGQSNPQQDPEPAAVRLMAIFDQLNDAGKNSLLALAESMLRQADFRQDGSISSAI